jgi:Zn ribbon nucleic-acid-binding protein
MWLPHGGERPNDLLWESIRRTGTESQLRDAFQITDPLWYGFWINSPLSETQCRVLSTLFTDLIAKVPRYRDRLEAFLDALSRSLSTAEQLHVELLSPGHVDMGWITIYVHCPRCKAEGPFKRWQESYPSEPINCPTCGFVYSPATTHSSEREYFAATVECAACQASHRIKDFSDRDIALLEDHHLYMTFCDELAWLRRVAAFYKRHPACEGKIKPWFETGGAACHELALLAERLEQFKVDWSAEDREVIDYLHHHSFSLQPRWQFVTESIDRLKPIVATKSVPCPTCGGKLQ